MSGVKVIYAYWELAAYFRLTSLINWQNLFSNWMICVVINFIIHQKVIQLASMSIPCLHENLSIVLHTRSKKKKYVTVAKKKKNASVSPLVFHRHAGNCIKQVQTKLTIFWLIFCKMIFLLREFSSWLAALHAIRTIHYLFMIFGCY